MSGAEIPVKDIMGYNQESKSKIVFEISQVGEWVFINDEKFCILNNNREYYHNKRTQV